MQIAATLLYAGPVTNFYQFRASWLLNSCVTGTLVVQFLFKDCSYLLAEVHLLQSSCEERSFWNADGKDTPQKEVVAAAPQAGGVPSCLEARKQARAVKPGSFMHLLMSASHTADGSPFSDDEIIGQAFIFLLAGLFSAA